MRNRKKIFFAFNYRLI